MSILRNVLQTNNAHIRDKNIKFYEPTHTYTIIPDAKSKYKSVTTWNHSHFPHFDADDIIKKMMRIVPLPKTLYIPTNLLYLQ